MGKGRLEAFSDGVIAIIITIMVLELKMPHEGGIEALQALLPEFVSYVVSFTFVAIYWNNHHHLFHAVHHVNGPVLWANMHLLFWLSLTPAATAWIGSSHFSPWSVALYGVLLLMAGVAYYLLAHCLVDLHGKESALGQALGSDFKGKVSVVIYAIGIPFSFVNAWVSYALYAGVALWWLVPDRRIERVLKTRE